MIVHNVQLHFILYMDNVLRHVLHHIKLMLKILNANFVFKIAKLVHLEVVNYVQQDISFKMDCVILIVHNIFINQLMIESVKNVMLHV